MARAILADEIITTDEVAEINQLLITCLEDIGLTDVVIQSSGALGYTYPLGATADEMTSWDQLSQDCQINTGWINVVPLYTIIRGNPENGDILALMADCLVRVGLRPAGYSAEDYGVEFRSHESGFSDITLGSPEWSKFSACNEDPAHAQ